jgi:hypothetical protein
VLPVDVHPGEVDARCLQVSQRNVEPVHEPDIDDERDGRRLLLKHDPLQHQVREHAGLVRQLHACACGQVPAATKEAHRVN